MAEILVIDDEPEIRGLIARVLTRKGHVVHQAANDYHVITAYKSSQVAKYWRTP